MYTLYNKLLKERCKGGGDEKKDVISYWTTTRKREDTGMLKRKN
jgi:hypothetical protein